MKKIIERIKRQSLRKLFVIFYNLFRMPLIKVFKQRLFNAELLQNIHPSTAIEIEKGSISLNRSVFTRKNVTFRSCKGNLIIGTSFFNQGCVITCMEKIIIGDGCLLGPNVVIVDHDHDYCYPDDSRGNNFKTSPVVIGKNVWIGANVVILKGTEIGDNCVIAAGLVVKGKFNHGTLVKSLANNQIDSSSIRFYY